LIDGLVLILINIDLSYLMIFCISYAIMAGAGSAPASSAVAAPAAAKVAVVEAADDMDDMFGGDDEEVNDDGETVAEAAASLARQARMAKAVELKAAKVTILIEELL
jgi:hypothetical protein